MISDVEKVDPLQRDSLKPAVIHRFYIVSGNCVDQNDSNVFKWSERYIFRQILATSDYCEGR